MWSIITIMLIMYSSHVPWPDKAIAYFLIILYLLYSLEFYSCFQLNKHVHHVLVTCEECHACTCQITEWLLNRQRTTKTVSGLKGITTIIITNDKESL